MQVTVVAVHECPSLKLYVEKVANQKGFGVGIVIVSLDRITIEKSLRLGFLATNNKAEYEALLTRVAMIKKLGGKFVEVFSDSRLVVGQIKGELEAKDQRMQGYLGKARQFQSGFESFSIQQVSRSRNSHADSLATLATSYGKNLPRVILVEDLVRPVELEVVKVGVCQIRVVPSWMDLIVLFLKEATLPLESGVAEKIQGKAPHFWLSEEQKLYKSYFLGPYLLCVHP